MRRGEGGFTLLEILVVLAILGMTVPLVAIGLSTTWKNFERLNVQNLALAQAKLPAKWFRDSITYAVLYHPDTPVVFGGPQSLDLVTAAAPNVTGAIPRRVKWSVTEEADVYTLAFTLLEEQAVIVKKSRQPLYFQYLVDEEWLSDFAASKAVLPKAVRVREGEHTWVLATPGRDLRADVPHELPLFGEYEF